MSFDLSPSREVLVNRQNGLTFIEVLVALVILSTGILGAVAMQVTAKKGSFDAMQRSLASSLAQDIIERMRVNDSGNNFLENYEGTYGGGSLGEPSNRCNTVAAPCNSVQLIANDLYEWEQKLLGAEVLNGTTKVGGLLNSRGCIDFTNSMVTVVVSWQGRTELADSAAASANNSTISGGCGTSGDTRRQVKIEAMVF